MTLPVRRSREMSRWDPPRWDPRSELEQLTGQMNQLFQTTFGLPTGDGDGAVWAPPLDIEETDDAYVIDADLPGVKRDDVNVEIRDNELIVTGEIKEKEREGLLRRRTRRVGRFEYRVILPEDIDRDNIEADLHEGVLTIRAPKMATEHPRRIQVKSD
ncbi:MAG TPA: Hsp20/alpha crystallin family protein [Jatrophihabitans sp.]|nr:Hsp20/alpha crystallin family protein [Jatrophihabitans sp.]